VEDTHHKQSLHPLNSPTDILSVPSLHKVGALSLLTTAYLPSVPKYPGGKIVPLLSGGELQSRDLEARNL
jgi:hypothetical protein